jgi:hypothetical protein
MIRTQRAHAMGIGHLYVRDKNGKLRKSRIRPASMNCWPRGKPRSYWSFTKDPSVHAFTDLLNRALDKPTEPVDLEHTGEVVIRWKDAADRDLPIVWEASTAATTTKPSDRLYHPEINDDR